MVESILIKLKDRNNTHRIEASREQLEKYLISSISKDKENFLLDEFEEDLEKNIKKLYL